MKCKVEFINCDKNSVELNYGDNLGEKLNIHNSPILFGCRIGICGTCAVEVMEVQGEPLHARTHDEIGFLEAMVPGQDQIRLACQIKINTNLKLKKTEI